MRLIWATSGFLAAGVAQATNSLSSASRHFSPHAAVGRRVLGLDGDAERSANASRWAPRSGTRLMRSEDVAQTLARKETAEGGGALSGGDEDERERVRLHRLHSGDPWTAAPAMSPDAGGFGSPPAPRRPAPPGPAALLQAAAGSSAGAGAESEAEFLGAISASTMMSAATNAAQAGLDLLFGTASLGEDVMDYPFACICDEFGKCKGDFSGRSCKPRAGTFSAAHRLATPLSSGIVALSIGAAIFDALGWGR